MKQLLLVAVFCAHAATAQTLSAPAKLKPELIEPELMSQGSPIYPPLAKTARISGQVKLEFIVNHDGEVASVMAVSGPAMLMPAAVDVVNQWKFRLPKRDSLEDLHLETVFDFRLSEDSAAEPAAVEFTSFRRVAITAIPVLLSDPAATLTCATNQNGINSPDETPEAELTLCECYATTEHLGAIPVMRAAGRSRTDTVGMLLRSGANTYDVDVNGWTPLMYAVASIDEDSIALLLARGANPNHTSLLGNSPLMISAARGEFFDSLIRAGADINAQNLSGTTTLMVLAALASSDEVEAALKAGADPTAQDNTHRTALDYLHLANCGRNPIATPKEETSAVFKTCGKLSEKDAVKAEMLLLAAMQKFRR